MIDRDVILDLLPLYRAGLGSAGTRRLVEAWLEEHPELGEEPAPARRRAASGARHSIARGESRAGGAGRTAWRSRSPSCAWRSTYAADRAAHSRCGCSRSRRLPISHRLPLEPRSPGSSIGGSRAVANAQRLARGHASFRHGQRGRFQADRPLLPGRGGESAYGAIPISGSAARSSRRLGSPNEETGMVSLQPEQQALAMEAEPKAFRPAAGAWGRGGSTLVTLERGFGRMAGASAGLGLGEAGAGETEDWRAGMTEVWMTRFG